MMRIESKPRSGGKTYELIEQAQLMNGQIVCINQHECRRVKQLIADKGYKLRDPITWQSFVEGAMRGNPSAIFIDNLDFCVESIARGSHVEYTTVSCPVKSSSEGLGS